MIDRAGVLGALLAGGRSTRMGQDKSLLRLGSLPLIGHIARLMQACLRQVIIVSDSPDKYEFLNIETIPDLHKEIGPLGGIHAALSYARTGLVFISSCDTPLVPPQLVDYLLNVDSPRQTRIPLHRGILQPLFGVYEKSMLPAIEESISNHEFSVLNFLEKTDFEPIEITPQLPFYSPDIFCNVNSPGDYARIQALFKDSSSRPVDTKTPRS